MIFKLRKASLFFGLLAVVMAGLLFIPVFVGAQVDPSSSDSVEMVALPATSVTESSARLRGEIEYASQNGVIVHFSWWEPGSGLPVAIQEDLPGTHVQGDEVSFDLDQLDSGTTYSYQVCGEILLIPGTLDCSGVVSFTTSDTIDPTIDPVDPNTGLGVKTIEAITLANANEVGLKFVGRITGGLNPVAQTRFQYGTNASVVSAGSGVTVAGPTNVNVGQSFNASVSGLLEDTLYYFRACARQTPTSQLVCGDTHSQLTAEITTTVSTEIEALNPSVITATTATLRGRVISSTNNTYDVLFELADSMSDIGTIGSQIIPVAGVVESQEIYTYAVADLNPDTAYYYRTCLVDDYPDVCSSIIGFITDDINGGGSNSYLNIATNSAADIDEDSARLRGSVESSSENNVTVWFEFDDNQGDVADGDGYTLSLSNEYDAGDDFSSSVYNLEADEHYYYRACGYVDGVEDCGQIEDFYTDEDTVLNSYNNQDPPFQNPGSTTNTNVTTTNAPGTILYTTDAGSTITAPASEQAALEANAEAGLRVLALLLMALVILLLIAFVFGKSSGEE